ncbi:uncharacterized protein RCC_09295 [Ramularia collo-cygni]|uniref:GH64 domain-containing protein n=1 Tax=Ramularia collo-cygni TaxID=112498 RepID=A0A2D3VHB1_9PEZI|nr:uncharacterized protein RCC_09295 [Ramularia collo-cygni]CZT23581.1 uncharacterized protein RCC_09295 [Ramularia collo-cygni]
MHTSISLPLLFLPSLLAPAFAIPLELRTGSSATERWVRVENTLNATTWNGVNNKASAPESESESASETVTTTTLTASSTHHNRPSRTAQYIYTPTIINAPLQPKGNATNNWNGTTSAANSTSSASSNSTLDASSNAPSSNGTTSSNATLTNATLANATSSNATSSNTTSSNAALSSSTSPDRSSPTPTYPNATSSDDASGRGMTHGTDGSFTTTTTTTTTNTTALIKTFNTTVETRVESRDLNSTLRSGDDDKDIDYIVTRGNTFTDIQGALYRSRHDIVAANGSRTHAGPVAKGPEGSISRGVFTLELVNRMPTDNVRAYISGLDPKGALVMLGQDGQWVYPSTTSETPEAVKGNIRIPMGKANSTTPVALPGFISSARVWIADGNLDFYVVATPNGPGLVEPSIANSKDPNSEVNYSFAEFSWAADYGIFVNISYVDFVGLPLGMELSDYDNANHSVLGVPSNAAQVLCEQLKTQAAQDGQPWDQLCAYDSSDKIRRVMAPHILITQNETAFKGYFDKYVDDVWSWYSSNKLTINTQNDGGNVTCSVQGDEIKCEGDNRGYAKPNAKDIFGCNDGPFAIAAGDNAVHLAVVPRLCAAFNRATFLLDGGDVQPGVSTEMYYPEDVSRNLYSDFVKQMQVEERGYAFSYDDVTPPGDGKDQSGLVSSTSPKVLRLIVGGS